MNIRTNSVRNAAARIIAALGLTAVLFACGTEIDPIVTTDGTLILSAGDAPDFSGEPILTKGKVYTEDGAFVFEDGDQIAIWYSDNQYRTFSVDGGIVNTGTQSATREKWAIYPASAAPSASPYSGENPKVIYATEYAASGSEVDSKMPLVAKNTEGNNKLLFYHVGGLLRLKLYGVPAGVRSVKVAFATSNVTGTYTVDVTTPAEPKTTGTGTGKVVTFNFPGSVQSTAYVNIPLPVGNYPDQDLTITLYDENGQVVKDSNSSAESFSVTAKLGSVGRRDGRMLGVSLLGFLDAVEKVELVGETNFLETRTGLEFPIGGLFLNDDPFESQLYATVFYRTGSRISDNSMVTWTSSDETKVRVDRGRVMAVDVTGDTPVTITAAAVDDPTKTASVFITVTKDSPTGNFVQKPFSVGQDGAVLFSPGNLVVKIANSASSEGASWRFATHQYDLVGPKQGSTLSLAAGDSLDVFYYSIENSNYGIFAGPGTGATTTQLNSFVDWGENQIAYRADPSYAQPNDYRALHYYELAYILEQRTGDQAGHIGDRSDCRYAAANVEGVYGLLVFPDGFRWVRSTMGDYPKRINTYAAPDNSAYSGTQWAALESEGVVFLPASGLRNSTHLTYVGTSGSYMTRAQSSPARYVFTGDSGLLDEAERVSRYTLTFSTFDFDIPSMYVNSTQGAVRLVRDVNVANKHVTKISINNDQPFQMQFGVAAELPARVTYSDGTTLEKGIVQLIPTADIPNTGFNQNIAVISGKVVSPLSVGFCLVYAEEDGIRSKPVVIGIRDAVQGDSGKSYFHLSDGTRVLFAPGNLRARIPSDNSTNPSLWFLAPQQYEYLAPPNYTQFPKKNSTLGTQVQLDGEGESVHWIGWFGLPKGDWEHFGYATSESRYGLLLESARGGLITEGTSFSDWGALIIQQPNSNQTYGSGFWKTPSFREWTDLLDRRVAVRVTGNDIYRPLEAEIFDINGNTCTILVPDGVILDLPRYIGDPITLARWKQLEDLGCVALPHSGMRSHTKAYVDRPAWSTGPGVNWHGPWAVNVEGYYWASDRDFEHPSLVDRAETSAYMTYLRSELNTWWLDDTGAWGSYRGVQRDVFDPYREVHNLPNVANMASQINSLCAVRLIRVDASLSKIPMFPSADSY